MNPIELVEHAPLMFWIGYLVVFMAVWRTAAGWHAFKWRHGRNGRKTPSNRKRDDPDWVSAYWATGTVLVFWPLSLIIYSLMYWPKLFQHPVERQARAHRAEAEAIKRKAKAVAKSDELDAKDESDEHAIKVQQQITRVLTSRAGQPTTPYAPPLGISSMSLADITREPDIHKRVMLTNQMINAYQLNESDTLGLIQYLDSCAYSHSPGAPGDGFEALADRINHGEILFSDHGFDRELRAQMVENEASAHDNRQHLQGFRRKLDC